MLESIVSRVVDRALKRRRFGFASAQTTGEGEEEATRRVAVKTGWGATHQRVRRIASPILDVLPPVGARLALIYEDGAPAFAAALGVLADESSAFTAWIRAHLARHPGQLEIGATKGVRIKVGADVLTITPLADGTLRIEAPNIEIVPEVLAKIGGATGTGRLALHDPLRLELDAIWTALGAHAHAGVTTGPGTSGPAAVIKAAQSIATTKVEGV